MVGVKGQRSGQHLVRWKEYRKANNVKIALRDFLALEKQEKNNNVMGGSIE